MQTLSSASRTCMASASAVECTATVGMPSSWQARNTRNAISPRLAIRILSNMPTTSFDDHQRLAELDRLAILDQDARDGARARRRNLVHGLHRFDDQERVAGHDLAADVNERHGARLGPEIGGAHHRRGDEPRMLAG